MPLVTSLIPQNYVFVHGSVEKWILQKYWTFTVQPVPILDHAVKFRQQDTELELSPSPFVAA